MNKIKLKDISEEMERRILNSMKRTWQAIGIDCIQCRIYCGEKRMPRAEVIEVVCDADRMDMYGDDQEAYDVSKRLDWNDMKKLGKKAFPFKTYGY